MSWASKKQSVIAQSTTEGEYVALVEGSKQAVWLRHSLWSIKKSASAVGRQRATVLFEDNHGTITLTDNPNDHPRTKHIAVRFHGVRDFVQSGDIEVRYISTNLMIADSITKALERVKLGEMNKMIGLND